MRSLCSFVDVHAHMFHEKFAKVDVQTIYDKCVEKGLKFIINNGLEPISNREVLSMYEKFPIFLPAIGIYPIDAACNVIDHSTWAYSFDPPHKFDVDAEIEYIDQMAKGIFTLSCTLTFANQLHLCLTLAEKRIVAIGECGLDRHYLKDDMVMKEQERVLRKLLKIGIKHDIPVILHTRFYLLSQL